MKPQPHFVFPPFRLEPANARLWRGTQLLPLRHKPFAILRYLLEHAGRLITKEELLKAVWPDARVSEGVLKRYIRDLREVLEDEAEEPRFIENVYGQGYRFIAGVASHQWSVASSQKPETAGSKPTTGNWQLLWSVESLNSYNSTTG